MAQIGVDEAGDTILRFTIPESAVEPTTLAGTEIEFWMAKSQDAQPVVRKVVGSGVTVTDAAGRKFEVVLAPGDTLGLAGTYLYEVAVRDAGGKVSFEDGGVVVVFPTMVRFNA